MKVLFVPADEHLIIIILSVNMSKSFYRAMNTQNSGEM